MAKHFPFSRLSPELQLEVIDYLSFEDIAHFRMTSKKYQEFISKPSLAELQAVEGSEWAVKRNLFACCHCLRLRPLIKFSERMLSKKRARGRSDAASRFCIECGLTIPWKDPGARGYSRGAKIRVMDLNYQVCKNCGLFTPLECRRGDPTWRFCPHGYESNRKKVDKSEELAKWRVDYQRAVKERDLDGDEQKETFLGYSVFKFWPGLHMHGLPPSCL
jgi:hypothetical protein